MLEQMPMAGQIIRAPVQNARIIDLIHRNPHIRIDLTRIDPIRRMIIVRQIGTDHKPMSVLIYRHLLILNTIIKVPVMFLVMPIRALKVQIIGLSMIGNV